MAKLGNVAIDGQSGTSYNFSVYPLQESFSPVGGVYAITKRTKNTKGGYSHTHIYVGQTGDLSERFDNHHKYSCFTRYDANCICAFQEDNKINREATEADLLAAHSWPCNG